MNAALGNVGKTVTYTDPLEANPVDQRESLRELVQDIDGARVELLVMLSGNPVYNTPADLKLDFNRLSKVKLRVHLSSHKDETSEVCHWHVPEAHYLESWGDTRTIDGTVSIVQPLIEPLYGSKSAHEVLAVFSEKYDRKAYEIVREYWQGQGASRQSAESSRPTTDVRRQGQSAEGSRQEQIADGSRQGQSAGAGLSTTPQPQASPAVTQTATAATSPATDFESRWRQALHDGLWLTVCRPLRRLHLGQLDQTVLPERPPLLYQTTPRFRPPVLLRSCFALIPQCSTGALPTMAGCRNCPNR